MVLKIEGKEPVFQSSITSIMGLPQHQGVFSTLCRASPVQETSCSARTLLRHLVHSKTGTQRLSHYCQCFLGTSLGPVV